jgi:probable F420-dependent oxidoreductase
MDFGLHLGPRGAAGHPDGLRTLAQHSEKLGLAYLGISDHLVFARQAPSRYPYSESGQHPVGSAGYCLDQLTCLAFAAAVTSKIRLLTSVMVVPHRPAMQTAKMLTSVDVLSKGRVTVGAGVGWLAEEMALLGSPPYDKRGTASNEYIEAFRTLWREENPSYDGTFVKFKDVIFTPKPVQKPGLPIWIGGEGKAARRRAGRLGDGWYPTIRNPTDPLDDPKVFATYLDDVRKECAAAGRDPSKLDVAMFAPGLSLGKEVKGKDGRRINFSGSKEQIAADARAYFDIGVKHIMIGFETDEVQDAMDRVEAFARDVIPLTR